MAFVTPKHGSSTARAARARTGHRRRRAQLFAVHASGRARYTGSRKTRRVGFWV